MGTPEESNGDLTAAAAVSLESVAGQQLVAELRRIKDASGQSFARLQTRTPYSRASLERYVNGKVFPSRHAVHALARACAADPEPLLQLWDAAAHPDSPPAADLPLPSQPQAPGEPTLSSDPRTTRRYTWSRPLMIASLSIGLLLGLLWLGKYVTASDGIKRPVTSTSGCRDYYADMHAYTLGRLCWTLTSVTVTGYLQNSTEPAQATAQLCISNVPNSCAQTIDLVAANRGQTTNYNKTIDLPSGYGAWVRACSSDYCSPWK